MTPDYVKLGERPDLIERIDPRVVWAGVETLDAGRAIGLGIETIDGWRNAVRVRLPLDSHMKMNTAIEALKQSVAEHFHDQ